MPNWLHLSGAEVVKALERLGYVQQRQRGSHVVMRKGASGCVVPLHRDVKVGTLAGLVRQASLEAEVLAALGGLVDR
jgi:predicted RNA binding protein YcfA (HicA-like mRNA interferase family)